MLRLGSDPYFLIERKSLGLDKMRSRSKLSKDSLSVNGIWFHKVEFKV